MKLDTDIAFAAPPHVRIQQQWENECADQRDQATVALEDLLQVGSRRVVHHCAEAERDQQLAQVESLFKPHAVSRAQAKGIWQFGKGTAIRYGLKVTRDVDERSDPEKSTRAAARYLNDLFAMFKDWNLVLAAYNWGEGKVQRLIKSTGLSDFWQLVDLRRKLPAETKNHVPLIQASVILGRNPEYFGLPTELDPPLKYAEVSVSKPIDLRAAAKVLAVVFV